MSLRIQKVIHVIGAAVPTEHAPAAATSISDASGIATSRIGSNPAAPLWLLPDNVSSHACNGPFDSRSDGSCRSFCPQEQLLWKTLRWIKLIAIKVGRSYYALPIALLLSVLLLGILLGFVLGRRYEQRRKATVALPATTGSRRSLLSSQLTQWCRNQCVQAIVACHVWCALWPSMFHRAKVDPVSSTISTHHTFLPNDTPPKIGTDSIDDTMAPLDKEERARIDLTSEAEAQRESTIPLDQVPRHVAVIMDGNRRYGINTYNSAVQGHWDGSRKLLQFAKWCLAEHVPELTVYAFSTENWHRDATEVAALMGLIVRHCAELRVEAKERRIRVRIISTQRDMIPPHIQHALDELQESSSCTEPRLMLNICLSYGSRGEMVQACRSMAHDYKTGVIATTSHITEETMSARMYIASEPDILIRTSGEMRMSNFMLWQLAYTELFFLPKNWPELTKQDFLQVLHDFALGRQRRFGK